MAHEYYDKIASKLRDAYNLYRDEGTVLDCYSLILDELDGVFCQDPMYDKERFLQITSRGIY